MKLSHRKIAGLALFIAGLALFAVSQFRDWSAAASLMAIAIMVASRIVAEGGKPDPGREAGD